MKALMVMLCEASRVKVMEFPLSISKTWEMLMLAIDLFANREQKGEIPDRIKHDQSNNSLLSS